MSTERKVQVFSTKGKRKATINTDATKWSELRNLIENEGYDVNKLHATENVTRTDLAHDDAVLPTGDFTIFLRPKKTKSGIKIPTGASFKGLRTIAKEYKQKDGDKFIDHLNNNPNGVNWTRLGSDDLKAMMESYGAKAKTKSKKAEKAEVEEVEEAVELNNSMRIYIAKDMLANIGVNTNDEMLEVRCDDIVEELEELEDMIIEEDGATTNVADLVDAIMNSKAGPDLNEELKATIKDLEEQLEAEEDEQDALEDEANKMLKGF